MIQLDLDTGNKS